MDREQLPIKFITLPETLPAGTPDRDRERYMRARYQAFLAQLEAVEIAAKACWPSDYQEAQAVYRDAIQDAKREKQTKLLALFSMECNSYGRR